MEKLSPEQWEDFKKEMKKRGVPFEKEKRDRFQQIIWKNALGIFGPFGSAKFRDLHMEELLKEVEKERLREAKKQKEIARELNRLRISRDMNAQQVRKVFETKLKEFIENKWKHYLTHPKNQNARIDKECNITHVKYGNAVLIQCNKGDDESNGIKVVVLHSQNAFGDSVNVTALRFVAECVLGDVLYYNFVGVEPADGSYLNVRFENIKFVDTGKNQVDEHTEIEIKTFPSLGMIWADNGHTKLV